MPRTAHHHASDKPKPIHPRMARTAEDIKTLDTQACLLRYRQLVASTDRAHGIYGRDGNPENLQVLLDTARLRDLFRHELQVRGELK